MKISKQSKMILGIVGVTIVAAYLFQKNKENKLMAGPAKSPAMTDASSVGLVKEGQWVVGGYDSQTNETYVYPEGNMGGGKRIKGRLNVPMGTRYWPAA
jgi:hypothetical protein